MSFVPIQPQHWVDRLRTGGAPASIARVIEVASDPAAVKAFNTVFPAIFVMHPSGTASASNGSERISQQVGCSVSILMVCQRHADPKGAQALTVGLHAMRTYVWGRLIGWTPPDCALPIELAAFNTEDWKDAVLYGYDRFNTRQFLTALPQ